MNKILQKHIAFWERAPGSVLIGELAPPANIVKPFPLKSGDVTAPLLISPEEIDLQRYVVTVDKLPPLYTEDLVNFATCIYPECWLEGMIGCDIYASGVSLSAKPAPCGPGGFPDISPEAALSSCWARLFVETQRLAVQRCGSLPACQLHLRGVVDMLAAIIGEANLCTLSYDHPNELKDLAGKCADIYLRAAELSLSLRPLWNGGTVSTWYVYAPGKMIDYQIDASSLFSPEQYRELFLPFDQYILGKYKYNVVHLHACGLHHVPALAGTEGVRCVEITIEKELSGYDFNKIREAVDILQQRGVSIIVVGELSREEIELYLSVFEPRGLAIFYWRPGDTVDTNNIL